MKDRRFVEETFPVKEVSVESAKEKSIRHGHISTLHIWWARRPLASSRAIAYAALTPPAKDIDEWNKKRNFIINLCKWENSNNKSLIEQAKKDILKYNNGKPPKVLDPFSGGGAIPLEALRLGCETYASDYNPVAVLIEKCTLEYPQKYGDRLTKDVQKWGEWVLEKTKEEIGSFYPTGKEEKKGYFGNSTEESMPVGYIWSRTIKCQNPKCEAEIPLMRQYWLAKKNTKKITLYPHISGKQVVFKIVGTGYEKIPKDFDPENGTVSQAVATCLVCGNVVSATDVRQQFRNGKSRDRMMAVVYTKSDQKGKLYRIANDDDIKIFRDAEKFLEKKRKELFDIWGFDPVPDEAIHTPDNKEYQHGNLLYNFTPVLLYGLTKWGDLFNARQKLAMMTFVEKTKQAYEKMLEEGIEKEYAKAVISYIAFAIDRQADYNSTLCVWAVAGEFIAHTFGRQALPMVWDYFELSPWSEATGDWNSALDWILRVLEHFSEMYNLPATVSQSSATSIPYPNDFFDAVFTDPPYYDNVPYSDISDFFYVWLKRTIGNAYPDLFSTPLTPKSKEAIAELPLLRGMNKEKALEIVKNIKTSKHFENQLLQSFIEINRVLKPDGVVVIVYAHKSTIGWETLINSLLDSGLVVTGAWPIHTEMKARLRANESAALASSIYMIGRKMKKESTGFYKEVKEDLQKHLTKKLDNLWKEGISGADFFISAIGSSIEVFGRYEKIIDDEGNVIKADKLLEEIRRIVTNYAVKQVLHNGFAEEISDLARFYVLWRWSYAEAKTPFDDAHKLAQSVGIDLPREWNKGFIQKDKEFIKVLGPDERKIQQLEDSELIDVLHKVLLLWKESKKDQVVKFLQSTPFGKTDVFYRVAQAISECLPNESKEKKLLDGFLSGKDRILKELVTKSGQRRLNE